MLTDDLMKTLSNSPNAKQFIQDNSAELLNCTLSEYLEHLLNSNNMRKSDVIRLTNLDRTYAYQIFNGSKKPNRDKLLQLAFGFRLSTDEAQTLLKVARDPLLCPRVDRDVFILAALYNKNTLFECNQILLENNLKLLDSPK